MFVLVNICVLDYFAICARRGQVMHTNCESLEQILHQLYKHISTSNFLKTSENGSGETRVKRLSSSPCMCTEPFVVYRDVPRQNHTFALYEDSDFFFQTANAHICYQIYRVSCSSSKTVVEVCYLSRSATSTTMLPQGGQPRLIADTTRTCLMPHSSRQA